MSVLTQQLTIAGQQERMLHVLDETVAFYTEETSRRAKDEGGSCAYFVEETGEMCAVGRCLVDAELEAGNWGDVEQMLGDHGDYNTEGQAMFKPEYQGLPLDFWSDLQLWHDNDDHWTDGEGNPPCSCGYNKQDCKEAHHPVQLLASEIRDNIEDGVYTRPR